MSNYPQHPYHIYTNRVGNMFYIYIYKDKQAFDLSLFSTMECIQASNSSFYKNNTNPNQTFPQIYPKL